MQISDKLPLKTILARKGLDGVLELSIQYCRNLRALNVTDPEIHAYWGDQIDALISAKMKIESNTRSLP